MPRAVMRLTVHLAFGALLGAATGAPATGPVGTAPDAGDAAPAAAPAPVADCSYCKARLQSVDALRVYLPTDWTLRSEREPVFGGDVLVVQAGRANPQTLLLLHGLGQNGFTDWLPVMPQLARRYHVIAVDLPGFGYSDAPAGKYSPRNYARVLQDLLARFAHGPAIVVGHSLGGAVALRLASDYPAQVNRLVLVDAAGILQRTAFAKHSASLPFAVEDMPQFLKDPLARLKDFGNAAVERVFGVPADPMELLRASDLGWATAFRGRPGVNAAMALVDEDFSAAVYGLKQPVQIIWGEADGVAPLRTGQVLARRLPNAQLQTLPGVGHTPMQTASAAFLAQLNLALDADPVAPAHDDEVVAANRAQADQRQSQQEQQGGQGPGQAQGQGQGQVQGQGQGPRPAQVPDPGRSRERERGRERERERRTEREPDQDLVCTGLVDRQYTGRYREVRIDGCTAVVLTGVTAERIVIRDAIVRMRDVQVHATDGVALEVVNSELIATACDIAGPIGVRADAARLDLAGVRIDATRRGVVVKRRSRLIASLNQLRSPEFDGYWHASQELEDATLRPTPTN